VLPWCPLGLGCQGSWVFFPASSKSIINLRHKPHPARWSCTLPETRLAPQDRWASRTLPDTHLSCYARCFWYSDSESSQTKPRRRPPSSRVRVNIIPSPNPYPNPKPYPNPNPNTPNQKHTPRSGPAGARHPQAPGAVDRQAAILHACAPQRADAVGVVRASTGTPLPIRAP